MNFLFLQTYVWVAKMRNFTHAAEQLGISQQCASARVAALEKELGVRLIRHELRAFELTPEGVAALEQAEMIVGQVAEFKARLGLPSSYGMNVETAS